MNLFEQLCRDEAVRLKPYRDSVGKLTIGIGRNLDDVGVTSDEAEYLCRNDIARQERKLHELLPWTDGLEEVRRAVLINMAFNLGIYGLLHFRHMLDALMIGDYDKAADEMAASKWADQVGARADRLEQQMRKGVWM